MGWSVGYGSTAFKETFDNFLSGISLALGTGSLSKAASFWQKAGVANDIDDLLQISESSIQDENVKTAINLFKTITGIKNVTQSGTVMLLNGKANPSILGGTTLDVKDVIDGMTKAKELQDQKKANEAKAKESKSAKSQTSSMRSQHCNL